MTSSALQRRPGTRHAASGSMETKLKYDRDKLVNLLNERAVFERAAVRLYDKLLGMVEGVDSDVVSSSKDALRRHRDEEREHAAWLEGLIRKLGGKANRDLSDAVEEENRALEQVISHEPDGSGLLPMFHAMLAAELMDAEGWKLLLELADSSGDDRAVRELRQRVEREDEHLALIRHIMLTLEKESVRIEGGGARARATGRAARSRGDGSSRRQRVDVDISGPARATTDHGKIRQWVEERGGTPARVKRTGRGGDLGIIRIDFPGYGGQDTLEHVGWNAWFRAFDENELAFVYDETNAADGRPSRFNKIIARSTLDRRLAGEHDASAHKGRRGRDGSRGGASARRGPSTRGRSHARR